MDDISNNNDTVADSLAGDMPSSDLMNIPEAHYLASHEPVPSGSEQPAGPEMAASSSVWKGVMDPHSAQSQYMEHTEEPNRHSGAADHANAPSHPNPPEADGPGRTLDHQQLHEQISQGPQSDFSAQIAAQNAQLIQQRNRENIEKQIQEMEHHNLQQQHNLLSNAVPDAVHPSMAHITPHTLIQHDGIMEQHPQLHNQPPTIIVHHPSQMVQDPRNTQIPQGSQVPQNVQFTAVKQPTQPQQQPISAQHVSQQPMPQVLVQRIGASQASPRQMGSMKPSQLVSGQSSPQQLVNNSQAQPTLYSTINGQIIPPAVTKVVEQSGDQKQSKFSSSQLGSPVQIVGMSNNGNLISPDNHAALRQGLKSSRSGSVQGFPFGTPSHGQSLNTTPLQEASTDSSFDGESAFQTTPSTPLRSPAVLSSAHGSAHGASLTPISDRGLDVKRDVVFRQQVALKNQADIKKVPDLREQAALYQNLPLEMMAEMSRNGEGTSSSEKSRQLFGIAWLRKNCQLNVDARIRRKKIYTAYLDSCRSFGIRAVNPASFGKLVKMIYPQIRTRRLGTRGHSKYHYCGIYLIGDDEISSMKDSSSPQGSTASTTPETAESDSIRDSARVKIEDGIFEEVSENFIADQMSEQQSLQEFSNVITFSTPNIEMYLPEEFDPEASNSLNTQYAQFANSMIDSFKSLSVNKMLNYSNMFLSNLPSPCVKLLNDCNMSSWVYVCEYSMYKEMVTLMKPLLSRKNYPQIIAFFKVISESMPEKFQQTASESAIPSSLVEARLKPMLAFCRILERFVLASNASHRTEEILGDNEVVSQMVHDWRLSVEPDGIVAREAPCGGTFLRDVLRDEVPKVLSDNVADTSDYGRMRRLTEYLEALPKRFQGVPARVFLLCLNSVLSSALRSIANHQLRSFTSWWILAGWVVEWMGCLGEMSGFLMSTQEDPLSNGSELTGIAF